MCQLYVEGILLEQYISLVIHPERLPEPQDVGYRLFALVFPDQGRTEAGSSQQIRHNAGECGTGGRVLTLTFRSTATRN